jgi:glycosyltransferase involved in cell wall biosynthesis
MARTAQKPIRVLIATPAGVDGRGGIDRIMATLSEGMDRQAAGDIHVAFQATRGHGHVALSPFYLLAFLVRMLAMRLFGGLDLVHINLSSKGSTYRKLIIAQWARLLRVPYVLHLHGANYQSYWIGDHSLMDRLIRRMFEGSARIIVLGTVWRDFVAKRAPAAADRIVIIPNATDAPALPHKGGGAQTHILFLGRIGDRKGVPQLGEALHRMQHLPGWRATIAGDGAVEEARQQALAYGIGDRVELPGWVGGDTVAQLLSEADVLVLPSLAENLPVSVIEGMAAGLAVVTTPVGAVEDIITDGVTGLLVPPGTVDELTDALTRVVEDKSLRDRLGTAARAFHRERLSLAPFAAAVSETWRQAAH